MLKSIRDVIQYKEMIKNLVRKDLRTKYRGSFLGFLWTFVNPLLQLFVYTIVFSTVMRVETDNFAIFLFIGLVPWLYFSTALTVSSNAIIAEKDLIKKVYFPKLVLPISIVVSNLINMLLTFIILFVVLIFAGYVPEGNIIWLPLIILVETVFLMSLSILSAGINVYFRDLQHILGIIVMGWFYFTPIVYTVDMVPSNMLQYFGLNPMAPVIEAFRDVLYYHQLPDIRSLLYLLLISILLVIFSIYVFNKLERNFAEEI